MQYEIMNRRGASLATREADAPNTVLISITDYDDEANKFSQTTWLKEILEIQFNDVEAGGFRCITKENAAEIADFVLRMGFDVKRIIVHCEFGQSRSAGVAAAISNFLEGHDNSIFINRKYYPNRTCYHYVLNALKKKGRSPWRIFRMWLLRILSK